MFQASVFVTIVIIIVRYNIPLLQYTAVICLQIYTYH